MLAGPRVREALYFLKCPVRGPDDSAKELTVAHLPEVTDNNFQAEVIEADLPTLVDFWAPWCGPCRAVAPVLEEIDAERDDVRVVKLNIDDNQQTAAQFGVMSIPTMILFKAGQPVKKIVGAQPKKRIEAELEPALA
ncbi:thioredoxin [Conexibacter sp. W3-3-2]|nr:thioredoxin [Conexibacter sp. W3-3-2]